MRAVVSWSAAIVLLAILGVSLVKTTGGQAKASAPLHIGRLVPPPVATEPTALPTDTPTTEPIGSETATPGTPTTHTPVPTNTRGVPSPVPTDHVSPTPCTIAFSDVLPTDWYYEPVRWLVCNEIASGYADGTFKPANNSTRAQLTKFIALASDWPLLNPLTPRFSDVPRNSPFYVYIETAASHGAISGYADGTFRPGNDVTRSQLCKIVVLSRGWTLVTPTEATFNDVGVGTAFFTYVETAVRHNVVSGYADGTFRPGNPATRAQLSKIIQRAYEE
jgi:hypothetical protein